MFYSNGFSHFLKPQNTSPDKILDKTDKVTSTMKAFLLKHKGYKSQLFDFILGSS